MKSTVVAVAAGAAATFPTVHSFLENSIHNKERKKEKEKEGKKERERGRKQEM